MPKMNRPDSKQNQQNQASFQEEAQTLKKQKADEFPASMNGIPKNIT